MADSPLGGTLRPCKPVSSPPTVRFPWSKCPSPRPSPDWRSSISPCAAFAAPTSMGAGHVTVIEPTPGRRALALSLGADVVAAAGEMTAGGFDVVFECAGVRSTVQVAVDLVRRGGVVTLVGFARGSGEPTWWVAHQRGHRHWLTRLSPSRVRSRHRPHSRRSNSDREPIHTTTVGLSELPEAIARLADDPTSAVKVLVDSSR